LRPGSFPAVFLSGLQLPDVVGSTVWGGALLPVTADHAEVSPDHPMTETISFKPASSRDYEFALALYLPAMKPLAEKFIAWNEAEQTERFCRTWKPQDIRMIFLGRRKIGWIQVEEMRSEIRLHQFFIAPAWQRQGIGSRVLNWLTSVEKLTGKSVTLAVLSNNPARRLYERFGFEVIGKDGAKLLMAHTR
jgi:ribosomal protein S18 acetylase RimI-like enzyme